MALHAQGLGSLAAFGAGRDAALRAVEHLGYVQVDTIAVVERAHHHTLWSRVPDYVPAQLSELQKGRQIFEYWSHAASILPMKDFRYSLPLMRSFRKKFHWSDDSPELRRAMKHVVARIRAEGPRRARDFESKQAPLAGVWTFGKIEKRALHELWMRGIVMVSARDGFQKSFDLVERVIPPDIDISLPTERDAADFLVLRSLEAHGIAREPELRYLRQGAVAGAVRKRLAVAVKKGSIVPVQVEGQEKLAYVLPEMLASADREVERAEAKILSPFDNLVIQRERLRWLFGFDYQIECYVPEPKRRYGHFVLPVLWGDTFAARLEAKARREDGTLAVGRIWYEPALEKNRVFHQALVVGLEQFAIFNGCPRLEGVSARRK